MSYPDSTSSKNVIEYEQIRLNHANWHLSWYPKIIISIVASWVKLSISLSSHQNNENAFYITPGAPSAIYFEALTAIEWVYISRRKIELFYGTPVKHGTCRMRASLPHAPPHFPLTRSFALTIVFLLYLPQCNTHQSNTRNLIAQRGNTYRYISFNFHEWKARHRHPRRPLQPSSRARIYPRPPFSFFYNARG